MNSLPHRPTLYVDLDGTVRKGYDELGRYVNNQKDVELFPGVAELLASYRRDGWAIVAVSNQGGIALGHVAIEQVIAALHETQRQTGGMFDFMFFCRHHPDAKTPILRECLCRKPKYGLIALAQEQLNVRYQSAYSFPLHLALMVGDREEDELLAQNAGIRFKWARDWRAETPEGKKEIQ